MDKRKWKLITFLCTGLLVVIFLVPDHAQGKGDLWEVYQRCIRPKEFIDLTYSFSPGIPHWSGFPDMKVSIVHTYQKDGFLTQNFTHVGQYGTHVDAPAHFYKGLRTLDEISVKEMIMPLVVINVSEKVKVNPDYELSIDDIRAWETKNGIIPEGAFVAMRSDWSKRWLHVDSFYNKDQKGQPHYPGWSLEALKFLFEKRKINAIGHETLDTDAAVSQLKSGFAGESYVLKTNHFQIELLANLYKVPDFGALVVVAFPKPKGGSGFPARVFAIVP